MSLSLTFTNASVLRADEFQTASLSISDGVFSEERFQPIDLSGYYILPGIIDLHGDAFERHIAPRLSAPFPIKTGLLSNACDAAAHGVTTAWLAQSWSWEGGLRGPDYAERLMEEFTACRPQMAIDTRIQIRCETHLTDTRDRLLAAIRRHNIDYVVFNDHVPEILEMVTEAPDKFEHWATRQGKTCAEMLDLMERVSANRTDMPRHLMELASAFDTLGVSYGSHDDPDGDTRERYRQLGARIAEFPTSVAAARAAKAMDDPVLMGAPNVARGGSQSGNVNAQKLVEQGLVDALVSDYHYPALAQAAFRLSDHGVLDFAAAWALISTNPARIMHLDDRGTLETGQRADCVIMNAQTRQIEGTLSAGRAAYVSGELAARMLTQTRGVSIAAQ